MVHQIRDRKDVNIAHHTIARLRRTGSRQLVPHVRLSRVPWMSPAGSAANVSIIASATLGLGIPRFFISAFGSAMSLPLDV